MKRYFLLLLSAFLCAGLFAQALQDRLSKAVTELERDPALRHAILSLCVEEAGGKAVYKHNAEVGLAVASSQKVLTSVAAFEVLGNDFRFQTKLLAAGKIATGNLEGDLIVQGSGDPSLGSWRWAATKPAEVLQFLADALKKAGIKKILGSIRVDSSGFGALSIPDGWIWQDIGNYYGAGSGKLNWKENQYDLQLRSGPAVGGEVKILNGKDSLTNRETLLNELSAAARGSGDNAIIYLPVGDSKGLVSGTIPAGETRFVVSGATPHPANVFVYDLEKVLTANGILVEHRSEILNSAFFPKEICAYTSPSFDSLNFWFLRRSINLYGEAFIKAISLAKTGAAGTNSGVDELRKFWAGNGIEKSAIKVIDGSGLSPQNRVTTQALVNTMRYASGKIWFPGFYDALPTINSLKMKSGSIGGARSFTGYVRKQEKISYIFAIVVNNYDGNSAAVVQKLYAILDHLK